MTDIDKLAKKQETILKELSEVVSALEKKHLLSFEQLYVYRKRRRKLNGDLAIVKDELRKHQEKVKQFKQYEKNFNPLK